MPLSKGRFRLGSKLHPLCTACGARRLERGNAILVKHTHTVYSVVKTHPPLHVTGKTTAKLEMN